jgi:hypothetical protein
MVWAQAHLARIQTQGLSVRWFDLAQALRSRCGVWLPDLIHINPDLEPAPFNRGWECSLLQLSRP